MNRNDTSWQSESRAYDNIVGQFGHYYHEHIILPKTMELLSLKRGDRHLDLGCGQGVLSRWLPKDVEYVGMDLSKDLIQKAKQYSKAKKEHCFLVHDITKPFPFSKEDQFSHATAILVLQNIEKPLEVFQNLKSHLKSGGKFIMVLNHPCFRIPRQSSWGYDEASKIQYRKIYSYMHEQKIPIQMHPGKGSNVTLSFHYPLSSFMEKLARAGFVLTGIHEWCSDKKSEGARAHAEDRARKEFPLFLTLCATLE
jgi:ubiquinone/menaquinone biosynthesis C-methylase UbiE